MKQFFALLLALMMLVSLVGCGGSSDFDTAQDNASSLWSEEKMNGVVHDGYAILAESATDEQLQYAAVYQCYPFQTLSGCQYLYRFATYVPNTGADGVEWRAPVYCYLPYDKQEDTVSYSDSATLYSELGNVRMMFTVFSVSVEDALEEVEENKRWEELSDAQKMLNYGLYNRLTADKLTFEDEGVTAGTGEDKVLGLWTVEDDKGTTRVVYLLTAIGTDGAGNLAIAVTEIQMPDATSAQDGIDYYMTESDQAVWSEIYAAYSLGDWFE